MKIAIVAHNLNTGGGLTVGKGIISALLRIAPSHEYILFVPEVFNCREYETHGNSHFVSVPHMSPFARLKWERSVLYPKLISFDPDWLWGIGNLAYPSVKCRQSLLIHNAHRLFFHKPYRRSINLFRQVVERYLDYKFKSDVKFVDHVYCQTETMRQRILTKFQAPSHKVHICKNSLNVNFKKASTVPMEIAEYYGKKFILFVPTRYYPAKNLEVLIETFSRHRNLLSDVICITLVSMGQDLGANLFVEKIEKAGLQDKIICLGFRPQEQMPQYYFAADAMILPTELESFSASYIEAMFFERPILTSHLDFAIELCGDAALYFDQRNPNDVCSAILRLKEDHALRKELVAKGKKIIGTFPSWDEIVANVLDSEGIKHLPI